MNPRRTLTAIAAGRLLFGLWMLLAPRSIGRLWLGPGGATPESAAFLRAAAGRDITFAVGSLQAAQSGADPKPWLVAGTVVDGTDAYATLRVGDLPLGKRLLSAVVPLLAVGANAAGLLGEADGEE